MDALEAILTRRSTRNFKPDPVEPEKLEKILLRLSRRLIVSEKNDRAGLMLALIDGLSVFVATLRQRDVPVVRLIQKALLFEQRNRLVDRRLGNTQFIRHINRADGLIRRTAQHDDGFKVILMGLRKLFHGDLQYATLS